MAKIIHAEFLSYCNPAQNSDKVFNIFLLEETDGSFSCISEYGRRGSKLVKRTLCENKTRSFAEGKLRQKLLAKHNHRSTPYSRDRFGLNYSDLAKEYDFAESGNNSNSENQLTDTQSSKEESESNVIEFPTQTDNTNKFIPKQTGILNRDQFDSLEI